MDTILHHWAGILMFEGNFIEHVFGCSRVTLVSMLVDGSSYVSFPRPSILCIHLVVYFESEMSDLLLGTLGHCPFHHYVLCWCDFISCLIWADHHFSLCFLFHHHPRFCLWFIIFVLPLDLFLQRPVPGFLLSLHHHYTSHYQFDFLHCLLIITIFTSGILSPWLMKFSIHVAFYT